MGCCDFCLIRDACSWMCSIMGSMCVSSCRCCVFVSVVHPVAILSAVFCVICSLLMFVSDAIGDHMVETYGFCYGFVCCEDRFLLIPPCC